MVRPFRMITYDIDYGNMQAGCQFPQEMATEHSVVLLHCACTRARMKFQVHVEGCGPGVAWHENALVVPASILCSAC